MASATDSNNEMEYNIEYDSDSVATESIYREAFNFKDYATIARSPFIKYDSSVKYRPIAEKYMRVLSDAIEDVEGGDTSVYINIFETVPLQEYFYLPQPVVQQVMCGYVEPNIKMKNKKWFRVLKMILLNYKIMIHAYSYCDFNNISSYERFEMHRHNARRFCNMLFDGFCELNKAYKKIYKLNACYEGCEHNSMYECWPPMKRRSTSYYYNYKIVLEYNPSKTCTIF